MAGKSEKKEKTTHSEFNSGKEKQTQNKTILWGKIKRKTRGEADVGC